MFRKVLIANRGAIACRIIRTLRRMSVVIVAVYSVAARHLPHVRAADEAVEIVLAAAAQSYLSVRKRAARRRRAHRRGGDPPRLRVSQRERRTQPKPARRCGIVFVCPTPAHLRFRIEAHGARDRGAGRRAAAAGHGVAHRRGRGGGEGASHRLSGDAEEYGGRRRYRNALAAPRRNCCRRSKPSNA